MKFCIHSSINYENQRVLRQPFDISIIRKNSNLAFEEYKDCKILKVGTMLGDLGRLNTFTDKSVPELGKLAMELNGSFTVIIVHGNTIKVITDCGGSIPVYYGKGSEGFALGAPVHLVAKKAGLHEWDYVSVTDYLINHTVCYHYTWYKGIKMVPPGSITTFQRNGDMEVHTYWEPREEDDIYDECNIDYWAANLSVTIREGVQNSLKEGENVRLLYTGGEDSRALLGIMSKKVNCIPTTVLIGNNSGGTAELIQHGETGLLYNNHWKELAEQMNVLIYDECLRDRIIERAFELAGVGFLEDTYAENVYKKLVD